MSWVRIDDHFYDHPKWADAPGDSIALWLCAMAWCNRNNAFDGRIPAVKLNGLVAVRNVKATTKDLVARRAFDVDGTGFVIHDYTEYQQNHTVSKLRDVRSAAGRKGAAARWGIANDMANMANGIANECQTDGITDGNENAPPTTTQEPTIDGNSPTAVTALAGDLPSRIDAAAEAYAAHALVLARAKGRKINDPGVWCKSAKNRILKDAELVRLCREYPTAPADVIAARVHGESSSLHLHDRVTA